MISEVSEEAGTVSHSVWGRWCSISSKGIFSCLWVSLPNCWHTFCRFDVGPFLIFPKGVSGRVLDNNQDSFFFPKWTLHGLLAEICRGCVCPVRTHVGHCVILQQVCARAGRQSRHIRHVASGSAGRVWTSEMFMGNSHAKTDTIGTLAGNTEEPWEKLTSAAGSLSLSLPLGLSFPQLCSLWVTLPLPL